ncbi:MAG: DUF2070 family protein [Candidatus Nezhaarchaeales archaeon]
MRNTKGSRAGVLTSGWPRTAIICLVGFASSILSALMLAALRDPVDALYIFLLGIVGIWLPAIVFSIFQSIIIGGGVMNLKRGLSNISALMTFILLTSIIGTVIRLFVVTISTEELIIIGTSLAASLNALVYRYMTGKSLAITISVSTIWPIISLVTISIILGVNVIDVGGSKLLLVLALMALPAIALSEGIDRVSEKLVGMCSKRVFRAYITNWLTGVKRDLEAVFNHIGTDSEVSCSLVFALDQEGTLRGIISVPQVHPGPLRNIGSSSLPSDLVSIIESNRNIKSIVFHGFATHASDITSSEDYREFLEHVKKAIAKPPTSTVNGPSSYLIRIDVGGRSVGCQLIRGTPLIFVSGEEKGIEDIPESVRAAVERDIEKIYGVKPILINAHNLYEEEVHLDPEKLKEGILKAVELAFKTSSYDAIKVGLGKAEQLYFNENHGIGSSGIRVLVTEFKGSKFCYVVIDANNASREFRSSLRTALKSLSFSDCEIFTTDNHTIVHLKGVRSKRGYYVLGEKVNVEDILDHVKRAIKEAEEGLFEAKVAYQEIKVKAHVLGDNGYRSIETLMDQAVERFKNLSIISYGLALAASLLLCGLT